GFEISRRDIVLPGLHVLARFWGIALHAHAAVPLVKGEWRDNTQGGRARAGNTGKLFLQPLEEELCPRRIVTAQSGIYRKGQQVSDFESRIHVVDVPERHHE